MKKIISAIHRRRKQHQHGTGRIDDGARRLTPVQIVHEEMEKKAEPCQKAII